MTGINDKNDDKITSPSVNISRDEESVHDNINLLLDKIPSLDSSYSIMRRIGYGAFSSVYLAKNKKINQDGENKYVAIKHIIPTSHPTRIYMELKCLKLIGGKDNVMKVLACIRQTNHIVLIMPYFSHDRFEDYVGKLSVPELRNYLKNILLAVKHVHEFGIIHRDIKPNNFLYNRKHERYCLVDFGLAQDINDEKLTQSIQETPHLSTHKTIKRKLNVGDTPVSATNPAKRLRQFSPPSASIKSILSSTNGRVNQELRRSPRKHKTSHLSTLKENLEYSHNKVKSERSSDKKLSSPIGMKLKNTNGSTGSFQFSPIQIIPEDSVTSGKSSQSRSESSKFGRLSTPVSKKMCTNLPANTPISRKSGFGLPKSDQISSLEQVQTKSGKIILRPNSCSCYGAARVCTLCLKRSQPVASRAGTPGYRAPEVLMRYKHQSTALDIWSVGVILLNLLSGCYPFFSSKEDLASLAEITTLLGTASVKKAAARMNKLFNCSEDKPAIDLSKLCLILRNGIKENSSSEKCKKCRQPLCICQTSNPINKSVITTTNKLNTNNESKKDSLSIDDKYPSSVYNLLKLLLDPCPTTRITAEKALGHNFLKTR